MSSYVPANLRRSVTSRADHLCEYCLIRESDTFFGCQIEHIISEKHGGKTVEENLALACIFCNRAKGSDIATLSAASGKLIRLFNPRTDNWGAHFQLDGERIVGSTEIGQATTALLKLNDIDRCIEREALIAAGRYPSSSALTRMRLPQAG